MTRLGGVDLFTKDGKHGCGVAFLLHKRPTFSLADEVAGSVVEVCEFNPYVVARFEGADNADAAFSQGLVLVQKGLDLMAARNVCYLSIRDPAQECLTWWRADALQFLQLTCTARMLVGVSATLGGGRPHAAATAVWHEAMRYFRLAQVAEDVFDAYRNLWLTLECLLSTQTPPDRGERECVWLPRALTGVHASLDLGKAYRAAGSDIVTEIINDLYTNVRHRLFHTKAERPRLVPGNTGDEKTVLEASERLTALVLHVMAGLTHVGQSSGWFGPSAFNCAVAAVVTNPTFVIASDCGDGSAVPSEGSPSDGRPSAKVQASCDDSTPGLMIHKAEMSAAGLGPIGPRRPIELRSNGTTMQTFAPDDELSLDGCDVLRLRCQLELGQATRPPTLGNYVVR